MIDNMSVIRAKLKWTLALLVVAVHVSACVPLNASQASLVGLWKVDWTCGVETLDLKPDGTYSHAIDFKGGGRLSDSGTWRIAASSERLSGAHVILGNALQSCSTLGDKLDSRQRADRRLETVWEWGRTVLLFNPDIQGFTRD